MKKILGFVIPSLLIAASVFAVDSVVDWTSGTAIKGSAYITTDGTNCQLTIDKVNTLGSSSMYTSTLYSATVKVASIYNATFATGTISSATITNPVVYIDSARAYTGTNTFLTGTNGGQTNVVTVKEGIIKTWLQTGTP